jgi:hypothetical protein
MKYEKAESFRITLKHNFGDWNDKRDKNEMRNLKTARIAMSGWEPELKMGRIERSQGL